MAACYGDKVNVDFALLLDLQDNENSINSRLMKYYETLPTYLCAPARVLQISSSKTGSLMISLPLSSLSQRHQ
jgi:hypothetical protein